MQYIFYKVENLEDPITEDIKLIRTECDVSFFSLNPIKNVASHIKYTAEVEHDNSYSSRRTYANSGVNTYIFYTYGEKKSLIIKGWTFPYRYRCHYYTSASGRSNHFYLKFTCKSPDGATVNVDYKLYEPFNRLFSIIVSNLVSGDWKDGDTLKYDCYDPYRL